MDRRTLIGSALGGAAALVLAGCAGQDDDRTASARPRRPASPSDAPSASKAPSRTPAPTSTPTPTSTPEDPIAGLTLEQRVGQLFMVGTDAAAASAEQLAAVTERHVGNVFLGGRSTAGAQATLGVVQRFTSLVSPAATAGLPMLVATDQEGGEVQVLRGPGFSVIPSGVTQGTLAPAQLQSDAAAWARELAAAGVNTDLAPVAGIVAPGASNPPIGGFDRQYGSDEDTVAAHAIAFAQGMRSSGVVTTAKHFPGLGRVTANTDTTRGVVDTAIGPDSPDVDVYRRMIAAGQPMIMLSTAVYSRIDQNAPGAFSSAVVTGLLRGALGFRGVVITDDVSTAKQVSGYSAADRAILPIAAGADIVLISHPDGLTAPMVDAVVTRARGDAAFAAQVDAAARRVVALKRSLA